MITVSAGEKYNRWTVIGDIEERHDGKCMAKCECGAVARVTKRHLFTGRSKSCGCFRRENTIKMSTKHGMAGNKLYYVWANMVGRGSSPTRPEYKNYLGRGITVCDRWRFGEGGKSGFSCFYEDMGDRPSPMHQIDRRDNDKGYFKGNCRWVTVSENNRNRRSTKLIEYKGKTMCMKTWCEELGIIEHYRTIRRRIAEGWETHEAFTSPVRKWSTKSCTN